MPSKRFQIKRVYDPPEATDGYRILVDRLWPRGLKKEAVQLDEWNKNIAPSKELREWFDHKEERFQEFKNRYRQELNTQATELERLKAIAHTKRVTLLYAARDPEMNNAAVLFSILTET